MGLVGLVLCIIAFFIRKSNRDGAKKCMNFALVFYGLGALSMLIRSSAPGYAIPGWGIVIVVTVFFLMIAGRLKLEEPSTNRPHSVSRSLDSKRPYGGNTGIDYKRLANEIFDVSLELTNHSGNHIVSKGAFRFSPSTIQSATLYGTGLYEYSVLLLRERMKKIYTNKVEFEAEDNKMIEVFAKKIQIPVPAFLKIVDRNGGVKKWENALLQEKELPMREYMDEVRVLVNKATRGLEPTASIKSESAEDFEEYDDEEDSDDGL